MHETTNRATTRAGDPLRRVLRRRDFRLLWFGQATSLLGDHFHFIAISWLVLQLTGDPLALGAVLALGGAPRAIFTLVGGAVTDRFSPRTVMLLSDSVRLALTVIMTMLVLTNAMQVWMFYVFALIFGVVSGFFMPASMAILPTVAPDEDLQGGNALVQGTSQLVSFVGPMMAGAAIAWFAHLGSDGGRSEQFGVGVALALDAATFAVSVATLWLIQARSPQLPQIESAQDVWRAIRTGLQGRIMSLIFFANVALAPLSQSLAGALSRYTVNGLFIGAGVAMLAVAAWLTLQPFVRTLDQEMATAEA